MKNKFKLDTPGRETSVDCSCYADPVLFLPWDDLPARAKKEFEKNGGIPCEGGGLPGPWCADCRFGEVSTPNDIT